MARQRNADELVQIFRRRVAQLETIPVNADGRPNISALARACGFDRKRFETNPKLSRALHIAIREIGLAPLTRRAPEEKLDRVEKAEVKRLRERVEIMRAELMGAKARIVELEKALQKANPEEMLATVSDLFLETGRLPR